MQYIPSHPHEDAPVPHPTPHHLYDAPTLSLKQLFNFGLALGVVGSVVIVFTFAATPDSYSGDINKDHTVSAQDLSLLLSSYDHPAANEASTPADVNKDGVVDLRDMSVVLSQYDTAPAE
jgi:hypothetical protein